jgi:hypothetical protein
MEVFPYPITLRRRRLLLKVVDVHLNLPPPSERLLLWHKKIYKEAEGHVDNNVARIDWYGFWEWSSREYPLLLHGFDKLGIEMNGSICDEKLGWRFILVYSYLLFH